MSAEYAKMITANQTSFKKLMPVSFTHDELVRIHEQLCSVHTAIHIWVFIFLHHSLIPVLWHTAHCCMFIIYLMAKRTITQWILHISYSQLKFYAYLRCISYLEKFRSLFYFINWYRDNSQVVIYFHLWVPMLDALAPRKKTT